MTASVLTEQCTGDIGRSRRGQDGTHKGLLWCLRPLLSPSTGCASRCEDLWRKQDPGLVGACGS